MNNTYNTSVPENVVELYLLDYEKGLADKPVTWAREKGYSFATLRYRAMKSKVKLPSRSICKLDKQIDWDSQLDILDGHLLGDGTLISPKKRDTSVFQISCKHQEYINYLITNTDFLLGNQAWEAKIKDPRTGKSYTRYWTKSRCSHFLEKMRHRWYPNGKKTVPEDLVLTNRGLLRFYLEDGCYSKPGITFSLHDFDQEGIERVKSRIDQLLDINTTIHYEHSTPVKLYISSTETSKLFSAIKCPVKCYRYKWRCAAIQSNLDGNKGNFGQR